MPHSALARRVVQTTQFENALARSIWSQRYRFVPASGSAEASIDATFDRVARALAAAEPRDRGHWAGRFREVLDDFRFLPGGRILAGAGTARRVTLFNCFVMGTVEDSLDGIFAALRESALTMQQGGGIGIDFSTLRPRAAPADATGGIASGPVSFMDLWNQMSDTVTGVGPRRGAMMGTLSCEHPDVADFIDAKRRAGRLTHFNLSVLVSDAFMRAVEVDADWTLAFARAGVERRVGARALWDAIVDSAYASAEPGVLFIDRIRAEDNLAYAETISATNPCGEIPLPPYGACDLGSINLTRFVRAPFTAEAALDLDALAATAGVATRMLDNVYEVSRFPLPQQETAARGSRRLGLGITGLADALAMLGLDYAAPAARSAAAEAMRTICESAYLASIELARERGSFERFDRERYLAAPFVARLPAHVRAAIARHGIRNSHLTAIAPAGTISLLAGNVSSGLEPVFALEYARDVRQPDGSTAPLPWRRTPSPGSVRFAAGEALPDAVRHGARGRRRTTSSRCRRRCSLTSTTRSRRPPMSPRTFRVRNSAGSIGARGSWASRAARCSGPTPSPGRCCPGPGPAANAATRRPLLA